MTEFFAQAGKVNAPPAAMSQQSLFAQRPELDMFDHSTNSNRARRQRMPTP